MKFEIQICVTPSGYGDVCQKVGGFYIPANNIKPPLAATKTAASATATLQYSITGEL